MQELELKSIKKGIEERNLGDLNIFFREGLLEIGCKALKTIYEIIDEELFIKNKGKHLCKVVKKDSKTLVTSLGEVKFARRLYRDKKGQSKYLFDQYLNIRKGARYTIDAEARAMEEVIT